MPATPAGSRGHSRSRGTAIETRRAFLQAAGKAAVAAASAGGLPGTARAADPAESVSSFIDARRLPDGETVEAEVCVIGAGAAGITIARELAGRRFRVALLESGGLDFDPETQDLYKGEDVGGRYGGLDTMRLRYFGGTTNHWAGFCRPLDPIAFEARPWVPFSGWPFGRSELVPYYRRAETICEIGRFDYGEADWDGGGRGSPFPLDRSRIRTVPYLRSPPTRFGKAYRDDLARAGNLAVYLHANLVEIETDAAAREVTGLRIATLAGTTFRVTGRIYVLAAGGIENARLLLLSDRVQREGLGNAHDLVGRFFMEHPLVASGVLLPSDPFLPAAIYDMGRHQMGCLTLAPEALRRENVLNSTIFLRAVGIEPAAGIAALKTVLAALGQGRYPDDFIENLRKIVGDIDDVAAVTYRTLFARPDPVSLFRLTSRVEPMPEPDSRITLAESRDRLGQRRVRLDWRLGDTGLRSIRRAQEILAAEMVRTGLGRVRIELKGDPPEWPRAWAPSGHHIGTTRMHRDPEHGVVDPQCRVHGMANLFIAGSSVFPASGCSNPTLTIVALALRLADRIKALMAQ